MRKLTFDGTLSLGELLDAHDNGDSIVCPSCGAEMVFVLDDETQERLCLQRGVYCSKDSSHPSAMFYMKLPAGFWDQFKDQPGGGK